MKQRGEDVIIFPRIDPYEDSLPDIRPTPGGILLVGINPSPVSVKAGHYYQGRLGKRLWGRLTRIGLLRDAVPGAEDLVFAQAGHGLTDIVKRPTPSAGDLAKGELERGSIVLREKIRRWKSGLVLFAFKEPATHLIGRSVKPGMCGLVEGVPAFLLSGPHAASCETRRIDKELLSTLGLTQIIPASPHGEKQIEWANRSEANQEDKIPKPFDTARTQRVTGIDIKSGRVRLPREAKRFFPVSRSCVNIVLRGVRLEAAYDPRHGPDRERSGVLLIGREHLRSRVRAEEVLSVSKGADGVTRID